MKVTLDTTAKRASTIKNIRDTYGATIAAIAAPYQREERETWFTQLKEADMWLADNSAPVPMISAMAAARDIPVALMVGKIKDNDVLFRQAVGHVLGLQQKAIAALE